MAGYAAISVDARSEAPGSLKRTQAQQAGKAEPTEGNMPEEPDGDTLARNVQQFVSSGRLPNRSRHNHQPQMSTMRGSGGKHGEFMDVTDDSGTQISYRHQTRITTSYRSIHGTLKIQYFHGCLRTRNTTHQMPRKLQQTVLTRT